MSMGTALLSTQRRINFRSRRAFFGMTQALAYFFGYVLPYSVPPRRVVSLDRTIRCESFIGAR